MPVWLAKHKHCFFPRVNLLVTHFLNERPVTSNEQPALLSLSIAAVLSRGIDMYLFFILTQIVKGNYPIDLCKKCIVSSDTHILSRMDTRAPLPDDDRASPNKLATKSLYPQPLSRAISSIPRTTTCFLMCHVYLPFLLCAARLENEKPVTSSKKQIYASIWVILTPV